MSKYRQIGFLMEAGQDVDPNEYQNNPEKINKLLSDGVDYKDKKKARPLSLSLDHIMDIYERYTSACIYIFAKS